VELGNADGPARVEVPEDVMVVLRIVLAGVLAAGLYVATLGSESLALGKRSWPYGPVSIRGGAFTVREGAALDLDDAAAQARRALPGYVVLVTDWSEEAMLVVGREDDGARASELRRWRDASGLPIEGPQPISMGRSAADWFSAERRGHDVAVAGASLALAAFAIVLAGRLRRRSVATAA
jgi:hypothetical protein